MAKQAANFKWIVLVQGSQVDLDEVGRSLGVGPLQPGNRLVVSIQGIGELGVGVVGGS